VKLFALAAALMAALACTVVLADDSAADSSNVNCRIEAVDGTDVKTDGELQFTIYYADNTDEPDSLTYYAELTDSDGSSSGSVSPTTSSSSPADFANGGTLTLTVTAPSSSGSYTLTVTWTETLDSDSFTTTKTATVNVHDPITLSMTMTNTSSGSVSSIVYFYVDGTRVDDSKTTLSIDAGESQTLTYDYYSASLSSGEHSFYVASADGTTIVSDEKTFYYDQHSSDWPVWLMAIILLIMIAVYIWVYRKPIKNYGKPKARR
jgi:hypothetical protein